jgi:glutamate-1-semialdehyde 2,1-aminomutase
MPDITVFGKILGGGFPVGAFCGRREVMERINSQKYKRPEYAFHGGTFTANPITTTAGLVTLKILEDGLLINRLNRLGDRIRKELGDIFANNNIETRITGAGSLFNVHFTKEKLRNASDAAKADKNKLLSYNIALIANGIFFLPTHNGALSTAHTKEDVEKLFSETEKYAKQQKN